MMSNFGFAQNKVDLEVKVQPAAETARGGEQFSYTITVSNIGSAKATNVKLISEPEHSVNLVANSISSGNCRFVKPHYQANLYCNLDDIDVGETVTIIVEVKIKDFGGEPAIDISSMPSSPGILESLGNLKKPNQLGTLIADVDVSAEESEEIQENNRAEVFVQLLPSKNKPPRITILSPKREAAFIKPLNKQIEVPIVVKAFDVDGKIAKVTVGDDK